MIVPVTEVIGLSLILFTIGLVGLFIRRDAITVFLCVEIMLNAANVAFVGFSRASGDMFGHVAALTVIAVAAAEAAVGLALVIRLHDGRESIHLEDLRELKG